MNTVGVAVIVLRALRLIDDFAHQTVRSSIDPPADCFAVPAWREVDECIEVIASWRVPAMVTAGIVGVALMILAWVLTPRLRSRILAAYEAPSWQLVGADRGITALAAIPGFLLLLLVVVLVLVQPHGPTIAYRQPMLSSGAATAVLLGLAVVIGVAMGSVMGFATRLSLMDEERERGIRRPAVRLAAAATTVPGVAFASSLVIEPADRERVTLAVLLPFAALAIAGVVAWTVAGRTGLHTDRR